MSREFRFFCVIWAMASCLFADDSAAAASGTFVDGRDGRSYRFVVIGEQTWMAENLDFGARIPLADNQGNASSTSTQKYCPSDSIEFCKSLGALYQWHSAMAFPRDCDRYPFGCGAKIESPHRGICPEGWHVPTKEEWMELQRFAETKTGTDAESVGGVLKSTTGWRQIVEGPPRGVKVPKAKEKCHGCDGGVFEGNGTDVFGFAALPAGRRYDDNPGVSDIAGSIGLWWSSSRMVGRSARSSGIWCRGLQIEDDKFYEVVWNGETGASLRCVKD